ncbi:META domain-containing protein [Acinetobacter sp. YH12227]|uniref:META domain-containing protein n=1 Tax=Acinetobacter sp. YH12227 TaxID=2601158 RepID=UPI0015D315AD|nr:META domain-containing protein [Acinetobacter sp. YH12227]
MLKDQQDKPKNKLKPFKITLYCALFSTLFVMAGCQSDPKATVTHKSSSSAAERPLQVKKINDGVQDVRWEIVQIESSKAKFFHSSPYLQLNSQFRQIQGNTGCNAIVGTYSIDTTKRSIDLNARAGYFSCDSALAQEAELSDALQAVTQFQIHGKRMTMQNSRGQTLLVLERK